MKHAEELVEKDGLKLVIVSHESIGLADFHQQFWSRGSTYLDPEFAFFRVLGGGRLIKKSPWTAMTPGNMIKFQKLKKKYGGDTKGEGRYSFLNGCFFHGSDG